MGRMTALLVMAILATTLSAKTIRHYDSSGRSTGRTEIDSNGNARYYDSNGRSIGRSSYTDSSGTTRYYDSNGRSAGQSTTDRGGTTRYYDGHGRSAGQSSNGSRSPAAEGWRFINK